MFERTAILLTNATASVLLILIRGYQLTLSPWIGRQCRFHPTCSHYASQAIKQHGPGKGFRLAVQRLLKCHPFHPGGVDLVPDDSDAEGSLASRAQKS